MRYQSEIKEILKVSEEFGSKIKNKYTVLQAIYREQNWKNNWPQTYKYEYFVQT